MTDKLKPCPFCGGEVYTTREDCYGDYDDYWMVHCDNCGLQFGFTNQFESEEEAINRWNVRKPMDRVVEQLEAIKMRHFLTIANTGDEKLDFAYKNVGNAIDKAIEIVKGGGSDD